ncbi:MAG: DNA polymerase IV [Chloroflexi bacterium]|nr:DNA polymerase IV [Chloroflexota bacterium]
MTRTILHLDLDAFFCAVEEGRNPKLRGQKFAVGGQPGQRGVVSSCSYPARQFGVHSAMPMSQAVRLCPGLIVVPADHRAYSEVSHKVMALLGEITPLIEQISIDEAFLDVTPQDGAALAKRLQAIINDELKLPCSFGVSTNKLVAKIANNVGKAEKGRDAPPNAIKVVPPGGEAAFLAPLPIHELWGVGPKTAERLRNLGIKTIGDLAEWREGDLVVMLGKHGADLSREARGIDDRPVESERDTKSISRETTFTRDVTDLDLLRRTIRQLSENVGWRVRKEGLRGNTVKIKVRWSNFTTLTRQQTFAQATDSDSEIEQAAQTLFRNVWTPGQAVRLIGVGVTGFDDEPQQMALFDDSAAQPKDSAADKESQLKLQNTLDNLRDRFGESIVKRGSDIRRKK